VAVLSVGLVGTGTAGAALRGDERAQIVGGTAVPTGVLPEMAFVQDEIGNQFYDCSGTVLSSNVVLTAGHCAYDPVTGALAPASDFLVATGRPDLADAATGHTSGVSQVMPYPGYDPTTHDGDAALLELSTPTTAPAITLATSNETSLWQIPTAVAIAGWGLTDGPDPYSQPYQVQWATTVTQTPAYCLQEASLVNESFDAAGQLCVIDAPTYTAGICSGDSGGPVLAKYLSASPIEVGITSWSIGNSIDPCYPGWPNFFTSAASISTWAENWVTTLAPSSPPKPTPTPGPAPRPLAGHYFGHSAQDKIVKVSVAHDTIDQMTLSYRLRCSQHHPLGYTLTTAQIPVTKLAFVSKAQTRNGQIFKVAGEFTTSGHVKGTMSVIWHSGHYGTCRTGLIHWNAKDS
jgi:secreted trypsin-like serine protease